MRIRSRREYGDMKENRGTYFGLNFSKGKSVDDQVQSSKHYKILKVVKNNEVRNPTIIQNDNNENGVKIVERANPDKNEKPPVMGKGIWDFSDDERLKSLVNSFGEKRWSEIARAFGTSPKTGKQCRERWHNHLRPDINDEPWTEEEENELIEAHSVFGNKWVKIAKHIPGRTENAIKNHWNTNKRKNYRKNSMYRGPRLRTPLQQYIALIDQNKQERNNAPKRNVGPKAPTPKGQMVYTGFNLNQPGMLEDDQEFVYKSEKLFQSIMQEAEAEMGRASAKSHPPEIPYEGEELFYIGTNSNLTPFQLHAPKCSDEIRVERSFTDLLLGVDVNSMYYAPEFAPSGMYVLSHNITPEYFGGDIGSSSSYSVSSEPAQNYYMNTTIMSSERVNFADVKGKGKMVFPEGDDMSNYNFVDLKGKGKMAFSECDDMSNYNFVDLKGKGKMAFSECDDMFHYNFVDVKGKGKMVSPERDYMSNYNFVDVKGKGKMVFPERDYMSNYNFVEVKGKSKMVFPESDYMSNYNFVDVKGKGKMIFPERDYISNFVDVKGKEKMFFPGGDYL